MTPEAWEKTIRPWVRDPPAFVRECIGVEPDLWQVDVLDAAGRGLMRIAMKACKGPGKSTVLAWLMWWFFVTRPQCKIVATSITEDNLSDGLWAELSRWQKQAPLLKEIATWSAESVTMNAHPETWFMSARTWPKTADPNKQADTLAGIHADHVMFVLDESGGIPRAVMATAEAGLANVSEAEGRTALLVQAGNPTDVDGPLYDACGKDRHLWFVVEVTGDPDDPKRSPRVSIEWAREQIRKYGADNPWVLVNVFGRFPPGASNALLGLEEVLEATRRVLGEADYCDDPKVLGVDVARFGDDRSVILARQGRVVFKVDKVFRNASTMVLASQVAMVIDVWKPDAVFIDGTGIGGAVVDRLVQLGYSVIEVQFGGKSSTQKWADKRGEMWGATAEWVRDGGCLPNDPELIAELPAPTYDFDTAGRQRLESKKDMKARGLPSPDKGDALALTFALPVRRREPGEPRTQSAATEYDPHA